ncbi:MAG: hypothetical protein ABIS36_25865 [Chryseolinea sp.]
MRIAFEPGVLRIISRLVANNDSPRMFYTIWRYSGYNATITPMGFLKDSNTFDSLTVRKLVDKDIDFPEGLAIFHNGKTFLNSDDYEDFLNNHTGKYGIPTIEAIQKSSSSFSGRIWMGEQYVGEPCIINVWATFEVDLNAELH